MHASLQHAQGLFKRMKIVPDLTTAESFRVTVQLRLFGLRFSAGHGMADLWQRPIDEFTKLLGKQILRVRLQQTWGCLDQGLHFPLESTQDTF